MDVQTVPPALREQLGADATLGFIEMLGRARNEWVADVTELSADRFERRLIQEVSTLRIEMSTLRIEMTKGFGDLRQEMATMRFELLKWSFAFWVGQVLAVAAILSLFLRRS